MWVGQITDLFEFLDSDHTEKLDFRSFCAGLEALRLKEPIHLSEDDYNDITEGYSLCSPDGTMTSEQFHMVTITACAVACRVVWLGLLSSVTLSALIMWLL